MPSGTVSLFNLTECPDGYSEFKQASGRFLVAAGTSEGSKNKYLIGQQGGRSEVKLLPENMPKIEVLTAKVMEKTTYKTAPITAKSVGALVEPALQVNEFGFDTALNIVPEYVALKACEKT